MPFSVFLTIAGIVVSTLIGLWGLYLLLRRTRYPASLTFVREQSVALLEDFAKKIPNLSVHYKRTPIKKNVVLLSGYLVNDGSVDITNEMTEQPLTCVLPGECSWLEFKLTTAAPALKVESAIVESRKVTLSFGLFRRDESFSFQALVLLDEDHAKKKARDLASEICWNHRIASLGAIKIIQMPQQREKKEILLKRIISVFSFIFYASAGLAMIMAKGPFQVVPPIIYQVTAKNRTAYVTLWPNADGTTTIKNFKTKEKEKVILSEFVKTAKFVPIQSEETRGYWRGALLGLLMLIVGIGFLFWGISSEYKRYKIRKLVAASIKET